MKYLFILLAVGLSACTLSPNLPKAGVDQSYEILGAKVNSPNEPNWYLLQYNQMGVVFGKDISSKTNSVIANANIFGVGGHEDDKSFFEYIISEREKNDDKTRFVDLGSKNTRVTFKGSACIKYETLSEDHASKSQSDQPFQYFNTMGYICRYPANKNAAVQLEVSYRSDTKEVPEYVKQVSEKFFDTLVFVNNKVQ
ncbi:hypothetical protein [Shewanella fodinae]|uniref:Lipoprotein n=1 Tax=Shewanella fodinae TaxID=552357 RepID=A0A4R2FIN2_9GAMM|nr:hypothetical protein [Shewanella fodinae]TCN90139.1 hypothetical protein EDC91_10251 [Shewanella fodinae]